MTIARAKADLHAERRRALRHAASSRALEEGRAELERLIVAVEEANLGLATPAPDFRSRLRSLAAAIAIPAPASIWTARTTARFHDALMEWEGVLLDRLAPQRLTYADRND